MFYSAQEDCFYPNDLRSVYEANGDWPADAVQVTAQEWKTYGKGIPPEGMRRAGDPQGHPTWVILPDKSLTEVAGQAIARINAGYQLQMGQILNEYPQAETLTFDKQEREARQWQADNSVATPYIDAMLAERPLDKAELVARILDKADAFTSASGKATGKRQRLEDEIRAAFIDEDRGKLESISW
ncbi:hypothetical protein [Halomonas sp. RT37]|uniref:Tail fiber assembly protein n=1 Tax=Halomonas sp. RT37 TaxID=2950872 RepID=A0AAU7KEY6_9GAMM